MLPMLGDCTGNGWWLSRIFSTVKNAKEGWHIVWFSMVWALWLARNERIFKDGAADERMVFGLVQR